MLWNHYVMFLGTTEATLGDAVGPPRGDTLARGYFS